MCTHFPPNRLVPLRFFATLLAVALFGATASAGVARYSSPTDAVQIIHPKVTYADTGITISQDFMVSLTLPGHDGDLVGGPGNFSYTWNFVSVTPTPAANTMFSGPMLSINGNSYGWLYGSRDGVLSMRFTGGHAKADGVIVLEEKTDGVVPVTQLPSSVRIRRDGADLFLEYSYSPMMPYQIGHTVSLGPDAHGPITYQAMWSGVTTVLSAIEVEGPMVPDIDQTGGDEGEGEEPEEGEGEPDGPPTGYGVAMYTDARDKTKIDIEGVSYDGGNIVITGSPYFTLPRKGGYLDNIPAGHFNYTVFFEEIASPSFPMGFAGISVKINGYDYLMLFRAGSPSGVPLQLRASRGMMGGLNFGEVTISQAPKAMRITRYGDTLTWYYSMSGMEGDFQPLAYIDLRDPLGDGSADDSMGEAQFDMLAFLDMTVSHIEVSGAPMYWVNNQYPWGPDAEVPVTSVYGTILFAVTLLTLGVGTVQLRTRKHAGEVSNES